MPDFQLFNGDCLDVLPTLPAHSIDLVTCDLPYGSTAYSWDSRIPLGPLWDQYRRILKPDGVVVLTADLRFAVELMAAAPKGWFRYDLVWDKVGTTGYLDANRRPLRQHELILVFSPKGTHTYHPQKTMGKPYQFDRDGSAGTYGKHTRRPSSNPGERYPTSILAISNANFKRRGKLHPTEKPVELLSWIVRTYSDPGDVVLDNAMGAGSTGLAALAEGRSFIGIERDPAYFAAAQSRIEPGDLSAVA